MKKETMTSYERVMAVFHGEKPDRTPVICPTSIATVECMELTGAIEGLKALKEVCRVELYSDSKYLVDAMEKGWAVSWRAHGWRKADKKPALNSDLWRELLELVEKHDVHFHWVKGHADNPYNNRCDEMAVAEWQAIKKRLGMV